jgi:hypothetical protein
MRRRVVRLHQGVGGVPPVLGSSPSSPGPWPASTMRRAMVQAAWNCSPAGVSNCRAGQGRCRGCRGRCKTREGLCSTCRSLCRIRGGHFRSSDGDCNRLVGDCRHRGGRCRKARAVARIRRAMATGCGDDAAFRLPADRLPLVGPHMGPRVHGDLGNRRAFNQTPAHGSKGVFPRWSRL